MILKGTLLICLCLVIFCLNSGCATTIRKADMNSETTLSSQAMKEDLVFLEKTIKEVHPDPYHATSQKEFEKTMDCLLRRVDSKKLTYDEFYFIVMEAIGLVKDAHTTAFYNDKEERLPLRWYCSSEGLFLDSDYGSLRSGDEVIPLGNKAPSEIIKAFSTFTPAENQQWIFSNLEEKLSKKAYLEKLGIADVGEQVSIEVKSIDNSTKTEVIKLLPQQPTLNNKTSNVCSYKILKNNNLAVLTLNACIDDDNYRKTLEAFFDKVHRQGISKIAIDVRKNMGGNSQVIDDFLTYTNVNTYTNFSEKINFSKQAIGKYGYQKLLEASNAHTTIMLSHKNDHLYDGKIYILTGKQTFSSGNWFGVIMKDNGIGTVVGEPTGNAPSSYGELLYFTLPNSKIKFQVSIAHWVRPNPNNDPATTLQPDILIPCTRKDIILGRDPVLAWLKQQ